MLRRSLVLGFAFVIVAASCGDSESGSRNDEGASDAATTPSDGTVAETAANDASEASEASEASAADSGASGDAFGADVAVSDVVTTADADASDAGGEAGPIVTTTHATRLAANMDMACVITTTGEVKCWGGFRDPTVVTSSGTWKSVAVAGFEDNPRCIIRSDDTLWCWSNGASAAPVQVTGTYQSVSAYAADRCAISSGALYCWGNNNVFGQLGLGDTSFHLTPTQVGSDVNWAAVALGNGHACALKTTGALYCWGWDAFGEVGDGVVDAGDQFRRTPVAIDTAHTYGDVAVNNTVTCAIRSDGVLLCWGAGAFGVFNVPTVIDGSTDWKKVRVGQSHECALKGAGELYCWGANDRGQLGKPVVVGGTSYTQPQRVGSDSDWTDIAVGDGFTCATKQDGAVRCWGSRADGRLGIDGPAQLTPRLIGSAGEFSEVAAGPYNTCVVRKNGELACFGSRGPLPNDIAQQTPLTIGTAMDWKTVKPGSGGACATKTNDALYCWYTGNTPASVNLTVQTYDVGASHQCAIASGSLYCWGDGIFGKLGNGSNTSLVNPTKVGSDTWKAVATAVFSTCAINSGGTLYCFGSGSVGIEKQGTATTWSTLDATAMSIQYYGLQGSNLYTWDANTPVASGSENDWTQIATGYAFMCGIRNGGTLWCKGDNSYGQLGNGTVTRSPTAVVQVGSATDWVRVTAGNYHACGIRGSGDLYCWGSNDYGEQGDGKSYTSSIVVVP